MSALAPALLRQAVTAFAAIPEEGRGPALVSLDQFLAAPTPASFLAATRVLRDLRRASLIEATAGATMRRSFADGLAALRAAGLPPALVERLAHVPLEARAGQRLLALAGLARAYDELASRVAADSDEMRRRLRESAPRRANTRR
jgi:hypothetical protein